MEQIKLTYDEAIGILESLRDVMTSQGAREAMLMGINALRLEQAYDEAQPAFDPPNPILFDD